MKKRAWRTLHFGSTLTLFACAVGFARAAQLHGTLNFYLGVLSMPSLTFVLFILLGLIFDFVPEKLNRFSALFLPTLYGSLLYMIELFGPSESFRVLRADSYGAGSLAWSHLNLVLLMGSVQCLYLLANLLPRKAAAHSQQP